MTLLQKERLITTILDDFKARLHGQPSRYHRHVYRMLSVIHDQLFDPQLSVTSVKDQCGLANNNIASLFRRVVGMPPLQYIQTRRIEAALRLLAVPDLEVYLIGLRVGYMHHESFTRAFRRYQGCAPSVYRRRCAEEKGLRESVKRKCQAG